MAGKPRRSPEEIRADRQDRLNDAHRRISEYVDGIVTGEDWKQWLDFTRQFHDYSINNRLLIASQRPDATAVMGYNAWQAVGRQVRRGEKGIMVLAPVLAPVGWRNPDGSVVRFEHSIDKNQIPASATAIREMVGAKPAYVFDVSQTDGDPLPSQPVPPPVSLDGPAPPGMVEGLTAVVAENRFRITRNPSGQGEDGYTLFNEKIINITPGQSGAQEALTLAHEVGHMLMHDPKTRDSNDPRSHRGIGEVEAETFAYLVSDHFGYDTAENSFPYVAGWAIGRDNTKPAEIVRATAEKTVLLSEKIINQIDPATPDEQVNPALARRAETTRTHAATLADTTTANRHETRQTEPAATVSMSPTTAPALDDPLAWALALHDAGFPVIRIKQDGSKAAMEKWGEYQQHRPPREKVEEQFRQGHPGIGVIMGDVAGGAEMLEFEGRAVNEGVFDQFRDQMLTEPRTAELLHRITERGFVVRSPSGGIHMFMRVEGGADRSHKLASRPARESEWDDAERANWEARGVQPVRVLAETRGEGSYVVAAGSHGKTHPTGRPWAPITGTPQSVPTLTAEERDLLHIAVRRLDQMPAKPPAPDPAPAREARQDGRLLPGDDYNQRGDWASLLTRHGWTEVRSESNRKYWRRPGKELGISAVTGGDHGDYMWVWSTSTQLPSKESLSKFLVKATLDHGGDFSAAASQLRSEGYGDPVNTNPRPQQTPTTRTTDRRETHQAAPASAVQLGQLGTGSTLPEALAQPTRPATAAGPTSYQRVERGLGR